MAPHRIIATLVLVMVTSLSPAAGAGRLRVVDNVGKTIGTVLDHSHALVKLGKRRFVSLRISPQGIVRPLPSGAFFYFETADCSGPKYLLRSSVLPEVDFIATRSPATSTAFDGLYYAGDPVSEKVILAASTDPSPGGGCDGDLQLPESNFCCRPNPIASDCSGHPPCTLLVGEAVRLELPDFVPPFAVK